MTKLTNRDFKTAQIAEMKPGESRTIYCESFKAVQSVRALCTQYIKFHTPENISRFATAATANEDGSYELIITALTD